MGASHTERPGCKLLRGPQSEKGNNPEPARGRQNGREHSILLFQETVESYHVLGKRRTGGPTGNSRGSDRPHLTPGRGRVSIREQCGEKAGRRQFPSLNWFFPGAAEPAGRRDSRIAKSH